MKMTSIEWLIEKTFSHFAKSVKWQEINMAKEMHKQEIMNAHYFGSINEQSGNFDFFQDDNHFYNETYCKISKNHIVEANEMVQISDDEISKQAKAMYSYLQEKEIFKAGAKWYREQLKSKS